MVILHVCNLVICIMRKVLMNTQGLLLLFVIVLYIKPDEN